MVVENHHVLPRSLGGTSMRTVPFNPREHFVAHRLLLRFLEQPSARKKMSYALCRMINDRVHTSRQYNYFKNEIRPNISGENNPWYGQRHTAEFKEKQSQRYSGSGNPNFGKKAWNHGLKNLFKHSDATKARLSLQKRGGIPHNKGCSFLPPDHYERLASAKRKSCTDGRTIFPSRKEAARTYNVSPTTITNYIKQKPEWSWC